MRLILPGGLSFVLTACLAEQIAPESQVWLPDEPTQCELQGWVSSRDIVTVRSHPNSDAVPLGTLPAMQETPDYFYYGVELNILGSQNGWINIEGAKDDPELTGLPARPTYSGAGWVPGSTIAFAVQSDTGYSHADITSEAIVVLEGGWLSEVGEINQVVACIGEWALLDYRLVWARDEQTEVLVPLSAEEQSRTQTQAWFHNICPLQETTCDP